MMNKELLAVAKGTKPADLVIQNGKIVNVYSGEIYEGGVAVCGDKIAAVGDVAYCIGERTKVIDAGGNYLTPGFLDGHILPESSSLAIRPFAEAVLAHGTTGIMTDLHEVGVVSGLEGIESILKEAEATDLKIYFVVPSHVPFSPNLETSGGRFNPEIIRKALQRPDAVGLSECVGPYILAEFPDLLETFDDTLAIPGMTLQGHLPDMYGPAMSACVAAGVSTDHESFCDKDVFERLRNGCHLMMREGSAARNMPALLKTVMEHNLDTSMVSIVTDDLHAVDLQTRGHLDDSLRTALGMGLDFVKAIQMVTVNCARAFNLEREIGGLAPGRRADINITTGPENFRVLSTFAGGRRITEDGKLLVHYETAVHEPCVLNTMHLKNPIAADSFKLHAPEGAKKVKAIVMDTLPYIPFTNRREVELNVVDGVVQCDVEQDVLYIAQVERHGKNGNIGKAFMGGFHIRGGEIAAEVAYPICGLLSDLPLDALAEKKKELNRVAHEMGTETPIPFMFLSFICLAAIPAYAITDCGFIDVMTQSVIEPILGVVE